MHGAAGFGFSFGTRKYLIGVKKWRSQVLRDARVV